MITSLSSLSSDHASTELGGEVFGIATVFFVGNRAQLSPPGPVSR